ncbi:MAG: hypothetical protein GY696_17625 [Gammaproteobacteria bacterium]|nr:hypothetical protein [Gammaproteobacteria bacterium]
MENFGRNMWQWMANQRHGLLEQQKNKAGLPNSAKRQVALLHLPLW